MDKEKNQCMKAALVLLIPSALALYGTKMVADDVQISNRFMERPISLIKKKQAKKAWKELWQSTSEIPIRDAAERIALILLFPASISFYIRSRNEILVKTKKLQKILKDNGFGRDGKMGLAVFLPIGILIDVTGHNPKDLVYNNAIWYALNIQVDEREWIERHDQRSIVLFKRAFTLAQEYIYK